MVESVEKVRNKIYKVKRPSVKWHDLLMDLEDWFIESRFLIFLSKHPGMSKNRCAYNVLKRYYSTTSLNRVRWLGVPLSEEPKKEVDESDLFSSIICPGSGL